MGQLIHLESFDENEPQETVQHPEYTRGHDAGFAAGLAAAKAAQDADVDAIKSMLEETHFTYAEARQTVLSDLNAVIDATLNTLLPDLVNAGLHATLAAQVQSIFAEHATAKMILRVHPDLAPQFETLVAHPDATDITVVSDPQAARNAIWMTQNDIDKVIDFEPVRNAVATALLSLKPEQQKDMNHG